MSREEVNRRREHMAMGLLARSGVGYILASQTLGTDHIEMVKNIGLAGSEPEAMVKVALMFAFANPKEFKLYVKAVHGTRSQDRHFRAVR